MEAPVSQFVQEELICLSFETLYAWIGTQAPRNCLCETEQQFWFVDRPAQGVSGMVVPRIHLEPTATSGP